MFTTLSSENIINFSKSESCRKGSHDITFAFYCLIFFKTNNVYFPHRIQFYVEDENYIQRIFTDPNWNIQGDLKYSVSSSPVMIFYSVNSSVITIYMEIFRFLGIFPSNIPLGSMIILFLPDLDNNNIAIRDEDCCLARAGWTVCCQQTLISLSLFFITIDRHTFSQKRHKGGS